VSYMYKAWICFPINDWDDGEHDPPKIVFVEPDSWKYSKVIPIVFHPLKEFDIDAASE